MIDFSVDLTHNFLSVLQSAFVLYIWSVNKMISFCCFPAIFYIS